jgi:hypothetical protein
VFGAQSNSALVQFVPYTLPYSGVEGYGLDPIIDSVRILLSLSGVRGDTTVLQRFDVWKVVDDFEPLHRDSVYYANFPIDDYKGERLFWFEHKGRRDVAARLFPTAAGKEYLTSLLEMEWDSYTNDTLFLQKYRGFVITPAEDSPAAAALYGADLSVSGLSLHVRNHDTLDRSAIYDTLTTMFLFRDTDQAAVATTTALVPAMKWYNISVNTTTFDYSGSVLGRLKDETHDFTDTLPDSPTAATLYVQAMGGVGAYLRFTDELVDEIRNLRFKTGESGTTTGKDIAINQAMMRIWLADPSTPSLDASMVRLGSYLNPKTMYPIPDYQYVNEVYRNQQLEAQGYSPSYTLPYNGYLNRSNGYYEFDITSYVQQLAKEKEGDPAYRYIPPAIFIAPDANNVIGEGQSVLKGFGSDRPVTIRVTYTIIEG